MLLVSAALAFSGVTEEGGDNQGYLVRAFQSAAGKPAGQSWCLDFVQACIAYVEHVKGIESPFPTTELCLDLWNRSPHRKDPAPGDVVIWRHADTYAGHCGIVVNCVSELLSTVEGNTSSISGVVERNGDGVYFKNRPLGGTAKFPMLGFVRPFP